MENMRWSFGIFCFVLVFIVTSSSAEYLIQQVTESKVASVSDTEYNSSTNLNTNLGMSRAWRQEEPSSKIITIVLRKSIFGVKKWEWSPSSFMTHRSFSVIKERFEPYESSVFEASGYKWRLLLYVTGKKDDGGNNHISLYARIEDTQSLPKGWEVNVDLKLFVHNPKFRQYLTVTDGTVKKYSEANREYGFGQLIPLSNFYNQNEGYIVQDTCSFGAEIFVVKQVEKQEKVTFVSNLPDNVFTWRVRRFSSLEDKFYYSDTFLVGDRYWRLGFNPKGDGAGRPQAVPIFLFAQGFKPNAVATTTWGAVNLRLKQQQGSSHKQRYSAAWYPIREGYGVGVDNIILQRDLGSGYLVNDSIVFEAEMVMVSVTNIVPM